MIATYGISVTPISALDKPTGVVYDLSLTSQNPTTSILINIAYDLALTSKAPVVSMTAALAVHYDLALSAPHPTVASTILSASNYTLALAAPKPVPVIDMVFGRLYEVSTSAPSPIVALEIISSRSYDLVVTAPAPSITATMAFSTVYALNLTAPFPSVAMSFFGGNTFDIPLRPPTPAVYLSITSVTLTPDVVESIISDTTTAWVVNLESGGHTRYTDFNFTNIFKLGKSYYGIDSNGINRFGGNNNNGRNIRARLVTAVTDFGVQEHKNLSDLYPYMRADGDVEVKITVDEYRTTEGYVITNDDITGLHRRRLKTAKGVTGTNWQVEFSNVDGCDMTIARVEAPINRSKRTI